MKKNILNINILTHMLCKNDNLKISMALDKKITEPTYNTVPEIVNVNREISK